MMMMVKIGAGLFLLLASVCTTEAFAPLLGSSSTQLIHHHSVASSHLSMSSTENAKEEKAPPTAMQQQQQQQQQQLPPRKLLSVPTTFNEMVRQVATCIKQAANAGETRQIVRVLLPRDPTSGDFGTYFENSSSGSSSSSNMDMREFKLVPTDESWQGGIMQLYRSAVPTGTAIVRQVTQDSAAAAVAVASGLPPRITEDRSVDESGVDGVGVLQTSDESVTCWIQPTQETVEDYITGAASAAVATAQKAGDKENTIVVLLNPQWRVVDDALDSVSQGDGLFSGLASFLGGKGSVLKQLTQAKFKPVYSLEGYVCKGSNVRLLQQYDTDWYVFCERDDGETFVNVGSSPTRPTYQDVEAMLNQANISYKYARDIGLAPKL